MRKLLFACVMVFAVAAPRFAGAQTTERGGQFDSCLRSFYDPDTYNWYSVENRCDEKVTVYVCGLSSGGCFEMNLRSGTTESLGKSSKEVRAMGGVSTIACRDGFIPVDANGSVIRRGTTPYHCKKS